MGRTLAARGILSARRASEKRHSHWLGGASRFRAIRLLVQYRSASRLVTGNGSGDVLDCGRPATINVRAFTDLIPILPNVDFAKKARLTLSVVNLGDDRQTVTDATGFISLSHQPAYRDPISRAIELELRKTF